MNKLLRAGSALLVVALAACGEEEKQPQLPQSTANPFEFDENYVRPAEPGRLVLSRTSVNFVDKAINVPNFEEVVIANDGESPVTLAAFQVHPFNNTNFIAFEDGTSCRTGMRLVGGQRCVLKIAWATTRPMNDSADMVVKNSIGQEVTINMQANAIAPVMPGVVLPPTAQHYTSTHDTSHAARASRGMAVIGVADSLPVPDNSPFVVKEPDYRRIGLTKRQMTLPVDRSRVITVDRYIPVVTETTIDTSQPGRVNAVVENHVFGADGRNILIPAGSRVTGRFTSLGRLGEERVEIVWQRVFRPDGASIVIEDRSADATGRPGAPAFVDTRFWDRYGSSLLTSIINAAVTYKLGGDQTTVTGPFGATTSSTGKDRALDRLSQDVSGLARQMAQEMADTRPRAYVPAGTRLTIIPSQDIWLRDAETLAAVKNDLPTAAPGQNAPAQAQPQPGLIQPPMVVPGQPVAAQMQARVPAPPPGIQTIQPGAPPGIGRATGQ